MAAALKYRGMNLSVIPIGKDKRPLVKWEEFQSRRPSLGDIKSWWKVYPSANVGIVTGKISGLAVVDCDSEDANKRFLLLAGNEFKSPIAKTPRGGNHYYCKHTNGQGNNTGVLSKVDLRAEGGYVVAPPSIGMAGNYSWTIPIDQYKLPDLPPDYLKAIREAKPRGTSTRMDSIHEWFIDGRRDEDLFSLAWSLVKSRMNRKDVEDIVFHVASMCKPPFPKKEAEIKVKSAVERAFKKERNLTQEIKNFIAITDGYFKITNLYNELQIITKEDKNAVRVALHRLKEEGKIEHGRTTDGLYRKVEIEAMPVDWVNAPVAEYPIGWPFSLESFIAFYPANVAVIAGSPNSGKTAFLLDVVKRNMKTHEVHFNTSEMGASETKIRLALHGDVGLADWKFNAWERSSNFVDVIRPDALNIIDYLEVGTEFYTVGVTISGIHEKLKNGVAILAIQKNYGQDLGRGASFGTEKPRLYLSLDMGTLKIIKAKNWKGTENPNGKQIDFKLIRGWKFIPESDWYIPQAKK